MDVLKAWDAKGCENGANHLLRVHRSRFCEVSSLTFVYSCALCDPRVGIFKRELGWEVSPHKQSSPLRRAAQTMEKAAAKNGSKSNRNGERWSERHTSTPRPEQSSPILMAVVAPLRTCTYHMGMEPNQWQDSHFNFCKSYSNCESLCETEDLDSSGVYSSNLESYFSGKVESSDQAGNDNHSECPAKSRHGQWRIKVGMGWCMLAACMDSIRCPKWSLPVAIPNGPLG